MKLVLKLVVAFTSTLRATALASKISDVEVIASNATYGDPRSALPFLRVFILDDVEHFYTTNAKEMQTAVTDGCIAEGTKGYTFANEQPSIVPLYRLANGKQPVHGFVYPDNRCGALPLFRPYNVAGADHFFTLSAKERDAAALMDGV